MAHIFGGIKRTTAIIALAIFCWHADIAIAAQIQGSKLALQPSGAATPAQMQQAETIQGLAPASASDRSIPIISTPNRDMGYLPLPYIASLPAAPQAPATQHVTQRNQPLAQAPSFSGFQALLDNQSAIPPDTMGAVGPNHVMTMLNSQVRIQSKTGTIINTVSLSGFWTAPQTGLVGKPFDPHVVYDILSGRWIAACTADGHKTTSQVWFAISATNDPTGTWTFYSFAADPNGVNWADYPALGVNSKWVAITANMFPIGAGANPGPQMWVIDKSSALSGGALVFKNFAPGFTNNGTMIPAVVRDAAEPSLYIVNTGFFSNAKTVDLIALSQITGTAPILHGPLFPIPQAHSPEQACLLRLPLTTPPSPAVRPAQAAEVLYVVRSPVPPT